MSNANNLNPASISEVEDENLMNLQVRIPSELHREIKVTAFKNGLMLREFVIEALQSAVAQQEA